MRHAGLLSFAPPDSGILRRDAAGGYKVTATLVPDRRLESIRAGGERCLYRVWLFLAQGLTARVPWGGVAPVCTVTWENKPVTVIFMIFCQVGVIALPEVTEYVLQPEDEFLVLASDGVWEFIDNQEASSYGTV